MIPLGSIVMTDFGVAVVVASTPTDDGFDDLVDARFVDQVAGYRYITFLTDGSAGALSMVH